MNEYPNVLILGDGLLGKEMIKQSGWTYLSMEKDGIDVVSDFQGLAAMIDDNDPDVIVNCIGYTQTYSPYRDSHWDINYGFVVNLVDFCDSRDIKIVHMSTDYIYANTKGRWIPVPLAGCAETDIPVHQETWYAYTKLISDAYVQLRSEDYLLIRGSLKPKPFPYENAFDNVFGNFDYVDVIAKQIITLINEGRSGIWNIGSEYKSVYDLAKQTKQYVGRSHSYKLPSIEMDLTKFNTRNKSNKGQ
jgi:dTDP-4-dehydrorhamnose reductase